MFEHEYVICRLCRKSSGSFVDIYNPKGTRGLIVWKVIKDLIQLDVSKDDSLPNTVCEECMDKVVEFKNFKALCINSRIEFLKESVTVGLVESELEKGHNLTSQRNDTVSCTSVGDVYGSKYWDRWNQDPLDQDIEEQSQGYLSEVDSDIRAGKVEIQSSVFSVGCTSQGLVETTGDHGMLVVGNWSHLQSIASIKHVEVTPAVPSRQLVEIDNKPLTVEGVGNAKVSQEPVEKECPSIPQGGEDLSRQYIERRLDDDIGLLKACDAPNCRKVFSSYKALVIHKRAKHSNVDSKGYMSVGDIPADQSLGSLERGGIAQHENPDRLHRQDGGIHIEEFTCLHPSCSVKFTNLSALLSHQLNHPPAEGSNRVPSKHGSPLRKRVHESDDNLEVLSDADNGNSGSISSDDCYEEEIQSVGSLLGHNEPSNPHGGGVINEENSMASHSGNITENPLENSIPEEPEFLCHWPGCSKAFHSFNKLLQHKKQKHSVEKGGSDVGHPRKKAKHVLSKRELNNLQIDMNVCTSRSRQSNIQLKETNGSKVHSKSSVKTTKSKKKDKEKSLLSTESSEGSIKNPTTYLCPWPNCHLLFNSSKDLHNHQQMFRHGRGMNKSTEDNLPEVGCESSLANPGKFSEKSDDGRNVSQVSHKNVGSSFLNQRENVCKLRIKMEPKTDASVGQSGIENGGLNHKKFVCEHPGCHETYTTHRELTLHLKHSHPKVKKPKKKKSNVELVDEDFDCEHPDCCQSFSSFEALFVHYGREHLKVNKSEKKKKKKH